MRAISGGERGLQGGKSFRSDFPVLQPGLFHSDSVTQPSNAGAKRSKFVFHTIDCENLFECHLACHRRLIESLIRTLGWRGRSHSDTSARSILRDCAGRYEYAAPSLASDPRRVPSRETEQTVRRLDRLLHDFAKLAGDQLTWLSFVSLYHRTFPSRSMRPLLHPPRPAQHHHHEESSRTEIIV